MSTTITVNYPRVLDPGVVEGLLDEAARAAMDAILPEEMTRTVQSGVVPGNLGVLRRAVAQAAQPAQVSPESVSADLVVAGEASSYAAVQDLGRRPGKPMSWRHLYYAPGQSGPDAWRGGWVNRRLRDWVMETAASLRADDQARASGSVDRRGGKPSRRTAESYERRAAWLLAVSIAARLRASGMKGKGFLTPRRKEIAGRLAVGIRAELDRALAELSGGAS